MKRSQDRETLLALRDRVGVIENHLTITQDKLMQSIDRLSSRIDAMVAHAPHPVGSSDSHRVGSVFLDGYGRIWQKTPNGWMMAGSDRYFTFDDIVNHGLDAILICTAGNVREILTENSHPVPEHLA